MVSESLKNNAKVLGMLFLILGIDKNVVDEHYDEFVKFGHEYRIHEIHEVGRGIGESKGHDQEFI